jgi:hypothetical protein
MATSINPRDVPLDDIRELARDRAELSSLRHLAPEIGLGHSTLHNFLNGAAPHPRVRRLLGLWYLRETGAEGAEEVALRPYASALDILLGGMPDSARPGAAGEVLDVIERLHASSGAKKPAWLQALRDQAGNG